jgi:hypothetical protein
MHAESASTPPGLSTAWRHRILSPLPYGISITHLPAGRNIRREGIGGLQCNNHTVKFIEIASQVQQIICLYSEGMTHTT